MKFESKLSNYALVAVSQAGLAICRGIIKYGMKTKDHCITTIIYKKDVYSEIKKGGK